MDSKITFFLDPQEWYQLLSELEFLLRQCYGEDLERHHSQIKMQLPNTLGLILSMSQFSIDSESKAIKLARETE